MFSMFLYFGLNKFKFEVIIGLLMESGTWLKLEFEIWHLFTYGKLRGGGSKPWGGFDFFLARDNLSCGVANSQVGLVL